jgi:hypothetical protein
MIFFYKFLGIRTLFKISIVFLIPIALQASYEIDIKDTGISRSFLNNQNDIIEAYGYRKEFVSKTGVPHSTKSWETFKENLTSSNQHGGIAGEVAAKFFFEELGYKILEDHYNSHISLLLKENPINNNMKTTKSCTTKKGPDNGIDGIFILKTEDFSNPSHIVINEAKFRNKDMLSKNDFGVISGKIQQSHSEWNKNRFNSLECLGLNYDEQAIVRTATLLDKDGTLKLYEVKDQGERNAVVRDFASTAPKDLSIRMAYDLFFVQKIGKSL